MILEPLHDRVIVQRTEEKNMTDGGIHIPDSAKEKPAEGEIRAVGDGKILENGEKQALAVKVGDRVLFGKYAGTEINIEGVEHLIMREEDIIARVK